MATRGSARRAPDGITAPTSDAKGAEHGALERLLDTERELVERLAAADAEAEAILAAARAAATQRERDFAEELEAEIHELRRRMRSESAQRVIETTSAAERDAARFEGMSDQRVAAFADALLDELFGAEAAP